MRLSLMSGIRRLAASAALYVGNSIVRPGFRISCSRPGVELMNTAVAFATSGDISGTGHPAVAHILFIALRLATKHAVVFLCPAVISRRPAFFKSLSASGYAAVVLSAYLCIPFFGNPVVIRSAIVWSFARPFRSWISGWGKTLECRVLQARKSRAELGIQSLQA